MFRVKHYTKDITQSLYEQVLGTAKEVTTQNVGKKIQAVFMTKPVLDNLSCGSGQQFNHALWCKDSMDNAFSDSADVDGISQVARYWLTGLVKHARGLTALCSPTVNCYRRLHGPSAPCKAVSSLYAFDQTASFRVNGAGTSYTFVENRLPGGSANPYIVFAGTVAAGLAGITNEYPPPKPGEELLLPKSLSEALDALEADQVLVNALGVDFVEWFVRNKREFEVNVLTGALTDESIKKEQSMYWNMFLTDDSTTGEYFIAKPLRKHN